MFWADLTLGVNDLRILGMDFCSWLIEINFILVDDFNSEMKKKLIQNIDYLRTVAN